MRKAFLLCFIILNLCLIGALEDTPTSELVNNNEELVQKYDLEDTGEINFDDVLAAISDKNEDGTVSQGEVDVLIELEDRAERYSEYIGGDDGSGEDDGSGDDGNEDQDDSDESGNDDEIVFSGRVEESEYIREATVSLDERGYLILEEMIIDREDDHPNVVLAPGFELPDNGLNQWLDGPYQTTFRYSTSDDEVVLPEQDPHHKTLKTHITENGEEACFGIMFGTEGCFDLNNRGESFDTDIKSSSEVDISVADGRLNADFEFDGDPYITLRDSSGVVEEASRQGDSLDVGLGNIEGETCGYVYGVKIGCFEAKNVEFGQEIELSVGERVKFKDQDSGFVITGIQEGVNRDNSGGDKIDIKPIGSSDDTGIIVPPYRSYGHTDIEFNGENYRVEARNLNEDEGKANITVFQNYRSPEASISFSESEYTIGDSYQLEFNAEEPGEYRIEIEGVKQREIDIGESQSSETFSGDLESSGTIEASLIAEGSFWNPLDNDEEIYDTSSSVTGEIPDEWTNVEYGSASTDFSKDHTVSSGALITTDSSSTYSVTLKSGSTPKGQSKYLDLDVKMAPWDGGYVDPAGECDYSINVSSPEETVYQNSESLDNSYERARPLIKLDDNSRYEITVDQESGAADCSSELRKATIVEGPSENSLENIRLSNVNYKEALEETSSKPPIDIDSPANSTVNSIKVKPEYSNENVQDRTETVSILVNGEKITNESRTVWGQGSREFWIDLEDEHMELMDLSQGWHNWSFQMEGKEPNRIGEIYYWKSQSFIEEIPDEAEKGEENTMKFSGVSKKDGMLPEVVIGTENRERVITTVGPDKASGGEWESETKSVEIPETSEGIIAVSLNKNPEQSFREGKGAPRHLTGGNQDLCTYQMTGNVKNVEYDIDKTQRIYYVVDGEESGFTSLNSTKEFDWATTAPCGKTTQRLEYREDGEIMATKEVNLPQTGQEVQKTLTVEEETDEDQQEESEDVIRAENTLELQKGSKVEIGNPIEVSADISEELASEGYQFSVEGPEGNTETFEPESTKLEYTPETAGTYTVNLEPSSNIVSNIGNVLFGTDESLAEVQVEVIDESKEWEEYCEEQGYEMGESENAVQCIRNEIIPEYFDGEVGEKPDIAQSMCRDLLQRSYNSDRLICE